MTAAAQPRLFPRTSARLSDAQRERGEVWQSVLDVVRGRRQLTSCERQRIWDLERIHGTGLGLLRMVLDERDEIEEKASA
jgi:hypothetical protein